MEWQVFPGEWHLDVGVLALALALDLAFRELPGWLHPVVWMGRLASWLEHLGPSAGGKASAFGWGAAMALLVPAAFGGLAWLAAVGLRELGPIPYLLGGAVLLSTTFAVSGLGRAARCVQTAMNEGSMDQARQQLRSLVSRDSSSLGPSLVSAAAIESVAENTTDSYIGPWLAFAVFGLAGAFAYRSVNTLDSMIGYRGRYEYLGKASAKLDDVMNLVPARISAGLMLAAGALFRLHVGLGWRWAWHGRRLTDSPNAGWTIGAMAGLLGVTLKKKGHYRIGEGMKGPRPCHIGASVRLAYTVAAMGMLTATAALALRGLLAG